MKEQLEQAIEAYITAFVRKQDTVFLGWVGDEIGETAEFYGDVYINFMDVKRDMDNQAPKGLIFDWWEDSMKFDLLPRINYKSYLMGLRYDEAV